MQLKETKINVEDYAELQDVLSKAPSDSFVLPEGGHAALEEYLTCDYGVNWKCRRFVCYKHNEELKPVGKEKTHNIPAPGNKWSNDIPARVIKEFTDKLVLTID